MHLSTEGQLGRKGGLWFPFNSWENWGPEKFCNLSKVKKLRFEPKSSEKSDSTLNHSATHQSRGSSHSGGPAAVFALDQPWCCHSYQFWNSPSPYQKWGLVRFISPLLPASCCKCFWFIVLFVWHPCILGVCVCVCLVWRMIVGRRKERSSRMIDQ